MREIEFRAWLKKEKKIVDVREINFASQQINFETDDDILYAFFDEIELLEYTGFKDKNGKKIFEGDIVRFEVDDIHTKPFYIDYDINDCSFSLFRNDSVDRGLLAHHQKDIVVIGNIWEHKEVLDEQSCNSNTK